MPANQRAERILQSYFRFHARGGKHAFRDVCQERVSALVTRVVLIFLIASSGVLLLTAACVGSGFKLLSLVEFLTSEKGSPALVRILLPLIACGIVSYAHLGAGKLRALRKALEAAPLDGRLVAASWLRFQLKRVAILGAPGALVAGLLAAVIHDASVLQRLGAGICGACAFFATCFVWWSLLAAGSSCLMRLGRERENAARSTEIWALWLSFCLVASGVIYLIEPGSPDLSLLLLPSSSFFIFLAKYPAPSSSELSLATIGSVGWLLIALAMTWQTARNFRHALYRKSERVRRIRSMVVKRSYLAPSWLKSPPMRAGWMLVKLNSASTRFAQLWLFGLLAFTLFHFIEWTEALGLGAPVLGVVAAGIMVTAVCHVSNLRFTASDGRRAALAPINNSASTAVWCGAMIASFIQTLPLVITISVLASILAFNEMWGMVLLSSTVIVISFVTLWVVGTIPANKLPLSQRKPLHAEGPLVRYPYTWLLLIVMFFFEFLVFSMLPSRREVDGSMIEAEAVIVLWLFSSAALLWFVLSNYQRRSRRELDVLSQPRKRNAVLLEQKRHASAGIDLS